jgi:hypothetical protein
VRSRGIGGAKRDAVSMTMFLAADVLRGLISTALAGLCWRSSPSPQKGELKMGRMQNALS